MATYVPAKRATAYRFWVGLASQANTKVLQSNPTLAAGDVQVSKDGGALANLTTLPVVTPSSSKLVQVDLSATEMTADNVTVIFSDAAGAQWCDLIVNIQTTARQIDDLAYPASAGQSIAVDASGRVDVGKVAGTAQTAGDIMADTNDIQSRLPAALVSGRMDASVGAVAAGAINAAAFSADALARLLQIVVSGTADSGTGTTMVDAARTESTSGYWTGFVLSFTSGALSGIERLITAFDPATDTITFAPALPGGATVSTETYEIRARARVDVGLWAGTVVQTVNTRPDINVGSMTTAVVNTGALSAATGLQPIRSSTAAGGGADYIDLDAGASATDNYYNDQLVHILTTIPQSRWIVGYVGATKRATVDRPWNVNPTGSTVYAILSQRSPAALAVTLANAQGVRKNTALAAFTFAMYDSAGAPKTGLTGFTAQRSLDGGAFSAIAGSVTEIASGFYKVDLAAGELNGEIVALRFAASGATDTLVTIRTVSP